MKLVIVESPAKCETIKRYLGKDYEVKASLGHIRDLATSGKYGLGVDIDNDFLPKYVIIKGKTPSQKKIKYLNQYQLHSLIKCLKLGNKINYDWLILLIAKTGMRFSEAIALTPQDFDFSKQTLSINKTWNYKDGGGFQPTKNKSSVRKIQIDWMIVSQFSGLIKDLEKEKPIFIKRKMIQKMDFKLLKRNMKIKNLFYK